LISSVTAQAADADRRYVPAPPPVGGGAAAPFSEAILANGTLYVAGHVGIDPATKLAATDVDVEARLVLDAVKKTVEQAGLSLDDLVSVTVYCTDLKLYDGFNAIYRTYFHGQYPTRAFIGVNQLVRGAHFEISGIAVAHRPMLLH
jgi:2-iminobutanoate/2-iminopropanoate deaminase